MSWISRRSMRSRKARSSLSFPKLRTLPRTDGHRLRRIRIRLPASCRCPGGRECGRVRRHNHRRHAALDRPRARWRGVLHHVALLRGAPLGLALGDTIELEWYDTRGGGLRLRTYTVNTIRVVAPEDVSLLAPTSDDALTLITCYPFGRSPRSPQRYIVRASPVGPSRSTQLSATAVDNLPLS